jgi:predicted DNA-binding ribbon-helix-helix protein
MRTKIPSRSITGPRADDKTTLSLERGFYDELQFISAWHGVSLWQMVERIRAYRVKHGYSNLSSAARMFILDDVKRRATVQAPSLVPELNPFTDTMQ